MRRIALPIVAAIIVLGLTGCDRSADQSEPQSAPAEPALAEPAAASAATSKAFSLAYKAWPVAVLESEDEFIEITPVETAANRVYQLRAGTRIVHIPDKPDTVNVRFQKRLSEADCVALCENLEELGFFEMDAAYSPAEPQDGGSAWSLSVTHNGVTKKVSVYNTTVPRFDKAVAQVRSLMR